MGKIASECAVIQELTAGVGSMDRLQGKFPTTRLLVGLPNFGDSGVFGEDAQQSQGWRLAGGVTPFKRA